jgi:hypothetical protein
LSSAGGFAGLNVGGKSLVIASYLGLNEKTRPDFPYTPVALSIFPSFEAFTPEQCSYSFGSAFYVPGAVPEENNVAVL